MDSRIALKIAAGGGWIAESVEVSERIRAPIFLVTFTRGSDRERVRLDLDKRMFIDVVPSGVTSTSSEEIRDGCG